MLDVALAKTAILLALVGYAALLTYAFNRKPKEAP